MKPQSPFIALLTRQTRGRCGFTVIEIAVAGFILVLIFLMGFTFFSGEKRHLRALTRGMDINAKVETAFRKVAGDVRSASEVVSPPLMDPADAPPDFEFEKNSSCELRVSFLDYSSTPITKVTSLVTFFLADPVKVGNLESGEDAMVYSLYKYVNGKPETPANLPLLDGVQELVFYRTEQKAGPGGGPAGTGFYVLHVNMKIHTLRQGAGKKLIKGYGAKLETMIKLRGSL